MSHERREFEQDNQNVDETTILFRNDNFSGNAIPLNDCISGDRFDFREALFLLNQAAPALLAFLLQYFLQVASVLTLGHLGSIELAALTLGSMYASITCWSICYGTITALDTLCPQGYTSGNPKMVGVYTQRSILIMMLEFIPIGIIWWVAEDVLISLGQEIELSKLAALYLRYSLWGVPPCLIFWCLEKFLQGQGIMKATTQVLLICCPANLILNYVLVWWEPIALGFVGAPIATSITNWLMLLLTIIYIKYIDGHEAWQGWSRTSLEDWSSFGKLAFPGILTSCADWWIYEIIALVAGFLGGVPLAAHRLILTIALLMFQLPRSVAVASSNRVGNLLGAGLPNRAKITTNVAFILAANGAACNAILLLFFKDSWGYLFSNDKEVVELVAKILPLAALFQLSDGIGAIGSGILRGQGRQKVVAAIYLSAYYLIALPLGLILAFKFNSGLSGLWWSVTCASINMGIGIFIAVSVTDWNLEVNNCLERMNISLRDEEVDVE
ncbi:14937_t:CDS:2 [Acaulospora morrowiae]|uniref:14937_t:CDS:1 n=1 Tax=Acaulospora morrowiae TaxID=94023 RepID=A0A9N9FEU4_9GLOM|nr:14937_t:CDS:2 [Acaulospora morrowiae]